jgi:hypothetical protein
VPPDAHLPCYSSVATTFYPTLVLFQILKWDVIQKHVIYTKSYDIFSWSEESVPLFSLSLSLSVSLLFLNEIMKNQVLNKIVFSVIKNFNATLMFYIYNKKVKVFKYKCE